MTNHLDLDALERSCNGVERSSNGDDRTFHLLGTIRSLIAELRQTRKERYEAQAKGFKDAIDKTAPGWRDLSTTLRMIRDAVEEIGPVGAVPSRDVGPPDFLGEAEDIIAGIRAIEAAALAMVAEHKAEIERLGKWHDEEMERVKACEHIAIGDEGWETLRNLCPSTVAVATLADVYKAALATLGEQKAEIAALEKSLLFQAKEHGTLSKEGVAEVDSFYGPAASQSDHERAVNIIALAENEGACNTPAGTLVLHWRVQRKLEELIPAELAAVRREEHAKAISDLGYQRIFNAIADATKIEAVMINISVDAFCRALTPPPEEAR